MQISVFDVELECYTCNHKFNRRFIAAAPEHIQRGTCPACETPESRSYIVMLTLDVDQAATNRIRAALAPELRPSPRLILRCVDCDWTNQEERHIRFRLLDTLQDDAGIACPGCQGGNLISAENGGFVNSGQWMTDHGVDWSALH